MLKIKGSFIFDRRGHLLVTEAGSGAVSSYALREDNMLDVIDATVVNGNSATCWNAGTWYGLIFTSNTASDNISAYKVNPANGKLRLLKAIAGSGKKPIDMAITPNGKYLYVLNAEDGTVGAFRIFHNGRLKEIGTVPGLPPTIAQGIAVR